MGKTTSNMTGRDNNVWKREVVEERQLVLEFRSTNKMS